MRNGTRIGTALGAVVLAAAPAPAIAAPAPAPEAVPCARGAGDEAALVRAFRAGGRIELARDCTYTVTRKHGKNSALPAVTRDTTIIGRGSTIAWGGTASVRTLIELAGRPRVRFVMRDLRLQGGPGMSTIRIRRHTSASIQSTSGGGGLPAWQKFTDGLNGETEIHQPEPSAAPDSGTTYEPGGTYEGGETYEGGYDVGKWFDERTYAKLLPAMLNGPLGGLAALQEALGMLIPDQGPGTDGA